MSIDGERSRSPPRRQRRRFSPRPPSNFTNPEPARAGPFLRPETPRYQSPRYQTSRNFGIQQYNNCIQTANGALAKMWSFMMATLTGVTEGHPTSREDIILFINSIPVFRRCKNARYPRYLLRGSAEDAELSDEWLAYRRRDLPVDTIELANRIHNLTVACVESRNYYLTPSTCSNGLGPVYSIPPQDYGYYTGPQSTMSYNGPQSTMSYTPPIVNATVATPFPTYNLTTTAAPAATTAAPAATTAAPAATTDTPTSQGPIISRIETVIEEELEDTKKNETDEAEGATALPLDLTTGKCRDQQRLGISPISAAQMVQEVEDEIERETEDEGIEEDNSDADSDVSPEDM